MSNILKNALTVAELIKKLQTLPQNLPVVLEGYEGGYNHELRFEEIEIALYVHTEDYLGNHEQPDYMTAEKQAKTYHLEQALVIRGVRTEQEQAL
jgi:hypothetical protein